MKDKWTCADLRKPTVHTLLDTLILLLIAGSYIPQIRLIIVHGSTSTITQSYVVLTYLFTTTQLALVLVYSSYGRPIMNCIKSQKLRGLDAYGAVIGIVQMATFWAGSVVLLFAFFTHLDQNSFRRDPDSATLVPNQLTTRRSVRYVSSICILYTCVWLLPASVISFQEPIVDPIFHPTRIFVGVCDHLLIPTSIVLVVAIFPLQIIEIWSLNYVIDGLLLSPITLALQMIAFILLAWSWKLSLGQPGEPFNNTPPGATQPWVIYRLGAWQWVNYMVFGVGQGLLLLNYLWIRNHRYRFVEDEIRALL